MALDGSVVGDDCPSDRPLQVALTKAISGVSEMAGWLGLGETGIGEMVESPHDDPNRDTWTAVHRQIVDGAEFLAAARGLHHRAAADVEAAELELKAISALVRRSQA